MTTKQIIDLARLRPELPWKWNIFLNKEDAAKFAKENNIEILWNEPILPGDFYIAKRNTGWKLLECKSLGEAYIYPVDNNYTFDFAECAKIIFQKD